MANTIMIESENDLLEVLAPGNELTLILKHSTRCSISSAALKEFEKFADITSIKTAIILVVENREVSNLLAEKVGVTHESPQAILIKDGISVWSISHSAITKNNLDTRINSLT